jgi:hypothetical protein
MLVFPPAGSAKTASVTYSISSGVSPSDEASVREGIALAIIYLHETYRSNLKHDLFVNVRDVASPTDPGILAFASGSFLVVFTGAPSWDYMAPALRLQVIIHEFVHIYQFDVTGDDMLASPLWIIEGMAEYVSFDVVQGLGVLDSGDVYDEQTWNAARGLDQMPKLSALEGVHDFQNADGPVYSLSYLAIDALVDNDPVVRLRKYLRLIAGGSPWPVAFEQAFGTKPEEFYEQFQHWVSEDMLAPTHEPASFKTVTADRTKSDVAITGSPISADPGEQVVVIAQTDPGTDCTFEFRDGDGKRADTNSTVADGSGLVFWLETLPAATSGGNGKFMINCGGARDAIDFSITG